MPILGITASSITANLVTNSYQSIATATPSGVSTVTFSSIPQTFTSLQIRIATYFVSGSAGSSQFKIRFNGDAGSNYWYHRLIGNGTTATSDSNNDTSCVIGSQFQTVSDPNVSTFIVDIHNYASTTQNKTVRSIGGGDNNGSGSIWLAGNLWTDTSAITSIEIFNPTFQSGSTLALYGIKGA
jgi:hypothetical protein